MSTFQCTNKKSISYLIGRLVVHDKRVVHEVEAVRLRLIGTVDHVLHHFLLQRRHTVDGVPAVHGARDAKTKFKVEALHQLKKQYRK